MTDTPIPKDNGPAPKDDGPAEILDDRTFRLLVENIVDYAIYMLSPDGTIRSWNRAAEAFKGYKPNEIIGKNFSLFFTQADREAGEPQRLLEEARTKGRVEAIGYRVRKDGSVFQANIVLGAIHDEQGKLIGFGKVTRDITHFKQAEVEHLASAERTRAIVETVPDAVITINAKGRVESFNPAAERMFGYGAKEIVGENIKILMPEPYHSEHDGYLRNYLTTGEAKIIGIGREVTAQKKDGSRFPIELAVGEFDVGDQKLFAGIIRDISERKEAERQQLDTTERTRAIVETVPDAVITINAKGRVESFNPAAERMFGYEAEAIVGENIKILMPEPYHSEHDGYLRNYLTTGEAKIIGIGREVTAQKKDGSRFPIELAVGEFEVGDQKLFAGIIRDISERKEAERQQLDTTERIRAIVETVPDGIITIDDQAIVETFNPAAEKLFGLTAEEVIGNNVKILMPEPYHSEHDEYLHSYHQTGDAKIIGTGREVMARRKNGSVFPIELAVGEIQLGDRRMYAGVVRDMTERKLAEDSMRYLNEALEKRVKERTEAMRDLQSAMAKLEEAQDQLVQTEKLASLGGLVAGIAHEINTPVGIGVTAASHLQEITEQLSEAFESAKMKKSNLVDYLQNSKQSTDIILNNLRRAAELINSFKQVAVDQSSSEQRRFNLKDYIDEVTLSLRPQLRKSNHEVIVDCPGNLELDTFPGALAQIITNMIINAHKHAFAENFQGKIEILVEEEPGKVIIRFRDNGRGISNEDLDKIFDPFFTTQRGEGGSGLGLHIVYNLATQTLKGNIEVISSTAEGTEFRLTIPTTG